MTGIRSSKYDQLDRLAFGLMEEQMSHCLVAAARAGGDGQEAKLKEASAAIAQLVRS